MSRTREERRRDRAHGLKMALAVLAVVIVLLILAALEGDKPPAEHGAREGAARRAAVEAYDAHLERYGDPVAAQETARLAYEKVIEEWRENRWE